MDAAQIRAQAESLGMRLDLLPGGGEWALLRDACVIHRARDLSELAAFLRAWREYVK